MRFNGNRSLQNLKFYFEIEIFSHYKVSALVENLTSPQFGGKYPLVMTIFQDGYLSKELSFASNCPGQFEAKLLLISEKYNASVHRKKCFVETTKI